MGFKKQNQKQIRNDSQKEERNPKGKEIQKRIRKMTIGKEIKKNKGLGRNSK